MLYFPRVLEITDVDNTLKILPYLQDADIVSPLLFPKSVGFLALGDVLFLLKSLLGGDFQHVVPEPAVSHQLRAC